ncbi:MAG: dTDP-4-dehydrorhamnose reductase [Planctomycetia bacterium]
MERVLVTGAAGMLGSEVLRCAPAGVRAIGTDLRPGEPGGAQSGCDAPGFDLADASAVERLFAQHGPFAGVIHCAAWTAVDLAEEKEAEAARANETACSVLARACAKAGIPLVVVSTDFVFDGNGTRPYCEEDPVQPLSAYGRTKLAGERAALREHPGGARIVRTQWLYGPRGKHFPGTIHQLASTRDELKVVTDQLGCPTTTLELAPALWDVLAKGASGIYHAACEGVVSWNELARATLELSGNTRTRVMPCSSAEFPRPARRPAYSALDCSKLARLRGRTLKPWREALADFLKAHPL